MQTVYYSISPKKVMHCTLKYITNPNWENKCLLFNQTTNTITYGLPEARTHRYDGAFVTTHYEFDEKTYNLIINTIKNRIKDLGFIPDSYEKYQKIENDRRVWVVRDTESIVHSVEYMVSLRTGAKMKVTLDDVLYYIQKSMSKYDFLKQKYLGSKYEDFVLSVYRPVFRREAGNKKTNTFDFIDIEMLVRSSDADKNKVKEHQQEIFDKAIHKIQESKQFQKYGVPVNILHMYQFVVRHDGTLIISFEVKGESDGSKRNYSG